MSNEQLTKFISIIEGQMENLESGRIDLVEIHAYISREEISGRVEGKVRKRPNEEEEEQH